jgi:hypothetical protein
MDLCGPITPASRGGNLYFLKIVDAHSKFRFIFPMGSKSDTFIHFQSFLNRAETYTGRKLKSVVSDNGGEFVNKRFADLFFKNGITHHTPAKPLRRKRQPDNRGEGPSSTSHLRIGFVLVGGSGNHFSLSGKSLARQLHRYEGSH